MPVARKIPFGNDNIPRNQYLSRTGSTLSKQKSSRRSFIQHNNTTNNGDRPIISAVPDPTAYRRPRMEKNMSSRELDHNKTIDVVKRDDDKQIDIETFEFGVDADGISSLFERAFSFTPMELQRLIDGNHSQSNTTNYAGLLIGSQPDTSNQNSLIQELKTALKTLLKEIEELKSSCLTVERKYKDVTLRATYDLRKSMNILFKMQQQSSQLQSVTDERNKLATDKL